MTGVPGFANAHSPHRRKNPPVPVNASRPSMPLRRGFLLSLLDQPNCYILYFKQHHGGGRPNLRIHMNKEACMSGYESIMLLCAVVTTVVTVASFVFAICKALAKKRKKRK